MNRAFASLLMSTLALAALALPSPAAAGEARCAVPEMLLYSDEPLPQTGRQIKSGGELKLALLGTNSSLPEPAKGMPIPYTESLVAELQKRLSGNNLRVANHSQRGLTAEQMMKLIGEQVLPAKPHLLIWQTGAVDAARQVDLNSFAAALENGLERLKTAGIDVVLVTPQFRTRIASMVDPAPYNEYMNRIGEAYDVAVFQRYGIMRHWGETAAFDLRQDDRALQMREAEAENRCLGKQLAEMILSAAKRPSAP